MVKISQSAQNKLTIKKNNDSSLTINVNDMIYFVKKSKGGYGIPLYGIIQSINYIKATMFKSETFSINIIVFSPKYYNSKEIVNELNILDSFDVIPLQEKNDVYEMLMEECDAEIDRYEKFAVTGTISQNEENKTIQKYTNIYNNFKQLLSQSTQGITYYGGKIKKIPTKKPPTKKPPTKKPLTKKPLTEKPLTKKLLTKK